MSATTTDDADRLVAYLVGRLERPLKLREVLEALQMSKTRYYAQRDDGTLIRPDNLVTAARNLDLNPVEILAHFGLVANEEVLDLADRLVPVHPPGLRFGEGVEAAASTVPPTMRPERGRRGARRARSDVPPLM